MMQKFKMVRSFFILRIFVFAILGVSCYILFTFKQYTIIQDLPNLWEVLITGLGGLFIGFASYYLSRYRTIGKVDDYLMGRIDEACNKLINADDARKLEPVGDECPYTPKLLVEQVNAFGKKILETFCRREVFQLVEGGIFSVKDNLLPFHPRAIHPRKLEDKISDELYEFIEQYVTVFPGEIAILISDRSHHLAHIVDVDNNALSLHDPVLRDLFNKGVQLPHEKAILTPITFDGTNIGYLLLFYHSQPFFSRLFNPKEMIDNYMLKKVEDWKLDDAVKSIINKERLLLAFFLEKCIDDITNKALKLDTAKEHVYQEMFPPLCKEILETICSIMKIDRGGVLCDSHTGTIVSYNIGIEEHFLRDVILSFVKRRINIDKQKVGFFTKGALEHINHEYNFEHVLFVNIEHENDDLGILCLFATRRFEPFDKMIMDIIEDIKLDDLFLLFHR